MKKLARVGIDVSAKELVVALERVGGALQESTFANDAAGHRKLIKHIGRAVYFMLKRKRAFDLARFTTM